MAQIIVEGLNPLVVEKLAALAAKNGRSLQTELKHILEMAAQAETSSLPSDMEVAIKKAESMRRQIASHGKSDNREIQPLNKQEILAAIESLNKLRETISIAGGMSIREMREEGRRF